MTAREPIAVKPWAELGEEARVPVLRGLISAATYNLRCVVSPPLGGMQSRDPELVARAEADIAAALELGWVDDSGTMALLDEARRARWPHTEAKR